MHTKSDLDPVPLPFAPDLQSSSVLVLPLLDPYPQEEDSFSYALCAMAEATSEKIVLTTELILPHSAPGI